MQLYERAVADGTQVCPYVWRIKFALAKKHLDYEAKPVLFSEMANVLGGRYQTVPIMVDGDREIDDGWGIIDYLEEAYPDAPSLFESPADRAMAGFFDHWLMHVIRTELLKVYTLDALHCVAPEDRDYYRSSREAAWGQTLEEVVADREERLQDARRSFEPIRQTIAAQPFIGGDEPNFADMCMLGVFIWAGKIGTLPLLAADDPLIAYAGRGFSFFSSEAGALDLKLSERMH